MRIRDGAASSVIFDRDADCSICPEERNKKKQVFFNLTVEGLEWTEERREKEHRNIRRKEKT